MGANFCRITTSARSNEIEQNSMQISLYSAFLSADCILYLSIQTAGRVTTSRIRSRIKISHNPPL